MSASTGALVGSLDETFGLFAAETVTMNTRAELYAPLEQGLTHLLNKFRAKNRTRMPRAVCMFRDGLGQSQVDAVREHEIPEIRRVFGDIPLAVVLVNKRHHIRIFKDLPNNKVANVDAGTVVDHTIVRDNCFVLCSHTPALGTSHPTVYEVIENDPSTGWDLQNLIEMTYNLAYLNPRTTRAGSVPVPITHAHLAAMRARQYESDSDTSDALRTVEGMWWV